jgi:polyferredoxin
LGDPYPQPEESFKFGINEIMLVVGIGMVIMFRTLPPLKKLSWSRYATLAFGLIVFGIWISSPLSLVNFVVWPVGFIPPWQTSIFIYILVFGIVGLALLFAKNFWCFWICPFAAAQEIMHIVGGGRVRPVTKRQQLLRNTRYFVLWLAVFLALVTHKPDLSVFEPWNTLFSVEGTPEQWILVGATLVVAIFIYDFWCHYLCPVGATMDIVLKIRLWFAKLFTRKVPPITVGVE